MRKYYTNFADNDFVDQIKNKSTKLSSQLCNVESVKLSQTYLTRSQIVNTVNTVE